MCKHVTECKVRRKFVIKYKQNSVDDLKMDCNGLIEGILLWATIVKIGGYLILVMSNQVRPTTTHRLVYTYLAWQTMQMKK